MFQLLTVLGASECTYNNVIGKKFLNIKESICVPGPFYIKESQNKLLSYMSERVNEPAYVPSYRNNDPITVKGDSLGTGNTFVEVEIYPIPETKGKIIISDKEMKFIEINVSDIPDDAFDVIAVVNVPGRFYVRTTADAKITLRGYEPNSDGMTDIYNEKIIKPDQPIKIETSRWKFIQLIVYADKSSNAIVMYEPSPDNEVDEDTKGQKFHGPVLIQDNERVSILSHQPPYFLETEKSYRRLYERPLGKCDYIIKGSLKPMELEEFIIPKGKTLCGMQGFIMGSKEKYSVKNCQTQNEHHRFSDQDIINQRFYVASQVEKNPNIFAPSKKSLFLIMCDEDNSNDCKFQMIGYTSYLVKNHTFIINPENGVYEIPYLKGFMNSGPVAFWSSVEKNVSFSPWIKNGIKEQKLNTKKEGHGIKHYDDSFVRKNIYFNFDYKLNNVTNFNVSISDVKPEASADEMLIPSIIGSVIGDKKELFKASDFKKDGGETPDGDGQDGGDKLSPGAIAGIVIAIIVVIAIIIVLVWFFIFCKKSDDKSEHEVEKDDDDSGSGINA